MSFDFDAFLADVLKNVPEGDRAGVEEALKLEAVKAEVSSGYSRQSDYSRNMDALNSAKAEAEAKVNQDRGALEAEKIRYTKWYEEASKDYNKVTSQLEQYKTEYGDMESHDPNAGHKVNPNLITREEAQREMNEQFEQRDRQAIDFANKLTDIKLKHLKQFDEMLDGEKLFEHVEKSGLRLDLAYEDLIKDQVEAARQVKVEEQVKQAREEGFSEGRSQQSMPVVPDPNRPHAIDSLTTDKPSTSEDRVAAAAAAYRAGQHA